MPPPAPLTLEQEDGISDPGVPGSAESKMEQIEPLQSCQCIFQKLLAIVACFQKQTQRGPSTPMQLPNRKMGKERRTERWWRLSSAFVVLGFQKLVVGLPQA